MNYFAIDTEFSSFYSPERHKSGELLQLSIVPVINGIEQKDDMFNEFCKPLTNVWNKRAEDVHKISRRKAELAQHPKEMAMKLKDFLSRYDRIMTAIGHSCRGDKLYIERLCHDYDIILDWHTRVRHKWKDTSIIAKKLKNQISSKSIKLGDLCRFFGIEINAHDALSDAIATSRLYQMLDAMVSVKEGRQTILGGASELEKRKKYIDMKYISMGTDGCVFLTEFCTSNREALRICLEEIWSTYAEV